MLRRSLPLVFASVALLVGCSHEPPPPAESPSAGVDGDASGPSDAQSEAAQEAPPRAAESLTTDPEPGAPAPAPAGKRAPCTLGQDQTCNADPSVSALWGRCLPTGTCECKPGFELSPAGYCQPAK
jgi:hypothetical protein